MKTLTKVFATSLLGASLLAGNAFAAAHMEIEQQAAELQQAILLQPKIVDDSAQVTVTVEDGRIVLGGFVASLEEMTVVDQVLKDMEGLDMDMVDNNIIVQ